MHLTPEQTIGSIVAEDHRAASVLTAHGIDFCCKGGRTVADVCRRKGIAPAALEREINDALARDTKAREDHRSWSLLKLADHIERVHHRYVEDSIPVLQRYLTKLCHVHGNRHPELFEVAEAFQGCASAMAMHMKKEELVLFPFIRQLERAAEGDAPVKRPHFGTVANPVHLMMADHDAEGDRFRRIAELTHGYVNPPDGCATYATAMALLRDFEADLHLHIHLENNILFPRAIALEKSLNP